MLALVRESARRSPRDVAHMSGAGRHPGRPFRLLCVSDREWSARFGGRRVAYSEEIALLKFTGSRTRGRLPRAGLSLCLAVAVAGTVATLGTGVAQAATPAPGSISTTSYNGSAWSPVSAGPDIDASTVAVSGDGRFVFRIDTAYNVSWELLDVNGNSLGFVPLQGLPQARDISADTDSAGNLQVFGAKSAYEASLVG
jgi:hypothetical protein